MFLSFYQKRQQFFGTSVCLVPVVIAACLVNFYPEYKYSANKLNNFNFNVFVSIAVSQGFITLALTFFNLDWLSASKEKSKRNLKNLKRKFSQPIQVLSSLLLSFVVFVPILCGGFLSSTMSPGESFAIVVSDPAATDNKMNISLFKIFHICG